MSPSVIAITNSFAPVGRWWDVLDWAEKFAAWEVIANFLATLVATALGVWLAVAYEGRRSRRRERQNNIRRGIALVEEAERYPLEQPIDDVSVMAVAFPLWLTRCQIAADLNEATPSLGSWVLWRLQELHHPGSHEMSASEVARVAEQIRGALHEELGPRRSRRPAEWYSADLERAQAEFAARASDNIRRVLDGMNARRVGQSAARPAAEYSRRSRLSRWWLAQFERRRPNCRRARRRI